MLRHLLTTILLVVLLAPGPMRPDRPPPLRPEPTGENPPQAVLEPALARLLAQTRTVPPMRGLTGAAEPPARPLRVILFLREQAEPEAVMRAAAATAPSPAAARAHMVADLRALADRTQAPIRAYLESARAAGRVEDFTPFWIFNGLAVRAHPDVIRTLANRPEVALIRLDHYRRWILTPPGGEAGRGEVEWNIARIRAPQVWASLGVDGRGAVVAGMDTGVDWLHPALYFNYRGYFPHGPAVHSGNWYDPVTGSRYPIDDHGHGSHTLGTAVGREGIGVAPGARWIGVKVLNRYGYGYDSWIHAGFQWLLAPDGDPSLAPDVVNCSWGDKNGASTAFQDDIRALRAAGIFVVFANGNRGPGPGTVISPASLPEAFAVGASDPEDLVAYFSSRGPSPWSEVRPHVVAPGVSIRSALPGGTYGLMSGTSMATPHVAGLVALMRAVSPTLSITRTAHLITATAVPLSTTVPNNESGWGRIDAFAAVAFLMNAGTVQGTVHRSGDGVPIPGATVTAVLRGDGTTGRATTDASGCYILPLAPGTYDVTAAAFGYEPAVRHNVAVTTGAVVTADFALTPLPTGTLRVAVASAADGTPVTATVRVLDTPLTATAAITAFAIPAGVYTVSARALGYHVVSATAAVTVGETTAVTITLPPAPSVLLVDSGAWYYGSQAAYYREALDDLALAYDERTVRRIPQDVPDGDVLRPYDVVIWSAPWDSPGIIGAQRAITEYLSAGGRLLISGQDVGFLDVRFPYYERYLKSRLVADNSNIHQLDGLPDGPFAGMSVTIAGAGGADNQPSPDVVDTTDPDAAAPVLAYRGDGYGGIGAGTCLPYRTLYLSFGFEAVNDRGARWELMRRALDWLMAPAPEMGLEVRPSTHTGIGLAGTVVTHQVRVRNTGVGEIPDIFVPSLQKGAWSARMSAPYLIVPSCTSATLVVSVTVPATATWDARDVLTLTVRSVLSPALTATAVLTTKTPAPVLLVDDDRWYEQREKYRAALDGADIPYDLWETAPTLGSGGPGGPPPEILARYPVVVWWTGYDWYEPVTSAEEQALLEYLDGGGRLFLTAQDFLYYHAGGPLAARLGVLAHTEDVTPTLAVGVPENPVGLGDGPWPLTYPEGYRNWSDEVIPAPGTAVVLRDQARRGIGLARRVDVGATMGAATRVAPTVGAATRVAPTVEAATRVAPTVGAATRVATTVFFPFPFEALPEEARPEIMAQIVGWLSWLGGSSLAVDRSAARPGETVTCTLHLVNDGPQPVPAAFSAPVPAELEMVPGSLTPPATYDPPSRRIGWAGTLGPGDELTVTWAAVLTTAFPAGAPVTQTAFITLTEQRIGFERRAVVRADAPDLGPSTFQMTPSSILAGDVFTGVLVVGNGGPAPALRASATVSLLLGMEPVSGTLSWLGGGTAEIVAGGVRWEGPLAAGARVTVTWGMRAPASGGGDKPRPYNGVAFLDDGAGGRWERPAWVTVRPWRMYLPVVMRGK